MIRNVYLKKRWRKDSLQLAYFQVTKCFKKLLKEMSCTWQSCNPAFSWGRISSRNLVIKFEVWFESSIEKDGWGLDRLARDKGAVVYNFLILATIRALLDAGVGNDGWVIFISILWEYEKTSLPLKIRKYHLWCESYLAVEKILETTVNVSTT